MLLLRSNGWASIATLPFFFSFFLTMLIKIEKVTVNIYAQGAEDRPVHVRAHYRVRNGRKEFVRAHLRRRYSSRLALRP